MSSNITENAHKDKSLVARLLDGEKVECQKCHKGIYQPFNPKAKVNHGYICDYCGSHFHWDPVVEIE